MWAADGNPWSGVGYGLRIADRLAALGLEVSLADLGTAEAPEALPGRLNVISGGRTSVSSQTDWMTRAQRTADRLVRAAQEHGEHLLGICLGSQLIAHRTAPGSVIVGTGMQAGLAPLTWCDGRGPAALASFHYERTDRLGPAWRPETAMREVLQRLLPELMPAQAITAS